MTDHTIPAPGGLPALPAPLFSFVILGRPVPWARARAYVKGGDGAAGSGSIGFATAEAQRRFKRTVGDYARVALLQARIRKPLECPIWLSVRVFLEVPNAWRKAADISDGAAAKYRDAMDGGFCLERPDLDNWVKLPMDAMNLLAWVDDSQVVGWPDSGKWFDHSRPRLEIDVREATR